MKKLFTILLSTVFVLSLVAFGGCSEKHTEYDINEYFQSMNEPHDLARFLGNEEPTQAEYLSLKAKQDVKITKISGTAYWNYDWLGDVDRKDLDKYVAPLPDSKFMTTTLVENIELTKNVPTHFDFVMTKESVRQGMNKSFWKDILKAGEHQTIWLRSEVSDIAIRNLKIEFEPA